MTTPTTLPAAPPRREPKHITALRRFAMSITALNVLGYSVLGFEQPAVWPLVALATAYTIEIGLETLGAHAEGRAARFRGNGFRGVMEFLYPAHITGLAVNMLSYPNDQIFVMMFGVAVAVGAKWVLRAPVKGRLRHFMNPSNFGIAAILMVFPWASIAPPYQFTERLFSWVDWVPFAVILVFGTLLNAKLTDRMWLIGGWLSFFVLQAVARWLIVGNALPSALLMMTGTAFILFTNYMITDPGTSPSKPFPQFCFGAGVATVYGVLTAASIPYGLFFATATVCLVRGGFLWALHLRDQHAAAAVAPATVTTLPVGGAASGPATSAPAGPAAGVTAA